MKASSTKMDSVFGFSSGSRIKRHIWHHFVNPKITGKHHCVNQKIWKKREKHSEKGKRPLIICTKMMHFSLKFLKNPPKEIKCEIFLCHHDLSKTRSALSLSYLRTKTFRCCGHQTWLYFNSVIFFIALLPRIKLIIIKITICLILIGLKNSYFPVKLLSDSSISQTIAMAKHIQS